MNLDDLVKKLKSEGKSEEEIKEIMFSKIRKEFGIKDNNRKNKFDNPNGWSEGV